KAEYLHDKAQIKSYQRCWRGRTQSLKINAHGDLKQFIINQFLSDNIYMSPKIISNQWNCKKNDVNISHMSIYKWLEIGDGNKYKRYLAHSFKGYKTNRSPKKSKIKGRISIEERSFNNENRIEKGHFEADLIVSKKGFKGALLTLVDRKTRFPRIFKLKDKSSKYIMDSILDIKDEIGIKTITFDNGMEFAKHYILNENGIKTYFSDPYSPGQKGSIENLNKMIRRTFPKYSIFDEISEGKIKSVCNNLANTPSEILVFLSPNQVHFNQK
ncbi:IS30 family transposase, partial [Candidatus Gracilibacteria bacterium]|nr:IS30 family transposase [Candidatus Gracilibacteria bacterium]